MPSSTGKGLSLSEALRVMGHISANEQNRKAFEASPSTVLRSLGIDPQTTMGSCDYDTPLTLPTLDELRDSHDQMTGKFLTAHAANTIHHVVR